MPSEKKTMHSCDPAKACVYSICTEEKIRKTEYTTFPNPEFFSEKTKTRRRDLTLIGIKFIMKVQILQ